MWVDIARNHHTHTSTSSARRHAVQQAQRHDENRAINGHIPFFHGLFQRRPNPKAATPAFDMASTSDRSSSTSCQRSIRNTSYELLLLVLKIPKHKASTPNRTYDSKSQISPHTLWLGTLQPRSAVNLSVVGPKGKDPQ